MLEKCKFCSRFVEAKEFMREPISSGSGKTMVDRRRCIVSGGLVEPDNGCDKLIPSKMIWCKPGTQWVYREVCVSRHIKKYESCGRCSIGKELVALMKRLGTKKRKRKLLVRKKVD